ncbi:heavy metal translocating P-type ATPase family protein [Candida parapsilosis]|uniref:Heavy metal translocating P-type ATPase family protein n=1 Tax=Candida parapsilosis TaxID=5480 RepID=A0A8X7TCI8_CANPA|nr:heavy metal translocating P-type ATPase family protein [Candida parapsilosis]KAF6055855.1 heavy metal translocating P-type ATPase family protein [Candida parapsilosis]KAF6058785.1 heavy metal translocating P-type ATPase family protein [Candida parapsilosis]KAF6067542.1 heavy metal translocating P-type ATPase family protein [Candida parapsilosis]KAI5901445.1 Copper-transporting ATPase HMA5 [Candida parapsilosis]
MHTLHIKLSNVHCQECQATIQKIISRFYKPLQIENNAVSGSSIHELSQKEVFFHLKDAEVSLYGLVKFQHHLKKLIKQLEKAGFGVVNWVIIEENGKRCSSQDAPRNAEAGRGNISYHDGLFDMWGTFEKYSASKSAKKHLKYCTVCRNIKASEAKETNDSSSVETKVEVSHPEYRASFAITGMTCSSCVHTVEDALGGLLKENKDSAAVNEPNFSVNLLQQSVVVIIKNKQLINQIIDRVNDSGFECKLIEVLPVHRSINTRITALIKDMTCSACANSIEAAVKNLPFILDSGINVVTKNAQFVLEDDARHGNLQKLKDTVEDCGFGFEIITNEKINFTSAKQKPRTINIKVEGMFCNHCPEVIMNYLMHYGDAVVVHDPISLKHPVINFTYIPSTDVTARQIIMDLNHLRDNGTGGYIIDENGSFSCELVKPVSVEEHIRKLTRSEVMNLALRLILATVFAIPTFILGIVAMSLLSKDHPLRIWVEQPIWVGNASRASWILLILSTPVYFFAADTFHRKAFKEIKSLWLHKSSFKSRLLKFGSMNLLMSLGTTVAYFASIALLVLSAQQNAKTQMGFHTTYFDSVVFLTFFLLIGKLLQSYSKSKTADAISKLATLKQNTAVIVDEVDGRFENDQVVDIELLEIGDYIKIGSGESPPVDCVIIDGESNFDESALTGESTPVKHFEGQQVFSGTVNIGSRSIIAKVISLEGDSLLSKIINTVRNGQLKKAPMERTADLITGYFVPIIIAIAVTTWIIWLSLGHSGALPQSYLDIDIGGWTVWSLEFAIAVFVVACPCGIGLAAPTALFVGSGLAAKYGILARGGGAAFQDGATTNIVCFDKTGTLTRGELTVTNYSFIEKSSILMQFSLQIARDLEVASSHPLAKAIRQFTEKLSGDKGISLVANKIPQVETVSGRGLKGAIVLDNNDDISDWSKYHPVEAILGNERLFQEYNVVINNKQKKLLTKWKTECKSVVLVGLKCPTFFNDDLFHLIFMMAARDQIRPETKKVIEYFNSKKIETWMITGDNSLTANAIANEIGITNVVSEVLPDEKEAQIKRIRQLKQNKSSQSKCVIAMVGDGINDAPALAAADVGIALSSGADLAVTSSDFILLNKMHPLISSVTLFDLSRVVFRRVKFNFAWSLVYNMIGLPIAAGVIYPYKNSRLDPVWASAAMALSSISVVLSSLALRFYRPKLDAKNFDLNEDGEVLPEEE